METSAGNQASDDPTRKQVDLCFVRVIVRSARSIATILLLMFDNPLEAWQQLSEHYRAMGDDELRELAADFVDLTEVAQQALRDEMAKRGLELPRIASADPTSTDHPVAQHWENTGSPSDPDDSEEESDLPHDYTWKVLLCECDTREKARQISEALRRGGVESWIRMPNALNPGVLVAADQLDQAREIAARPIPQEIIDESMEEVPEFKAPVCPKCGAADPALEGVDPVNTWHCESCDYEWTDSVEDLKEKE